MATTPMSYDTWGAKKPTLRSHTKTWTTTDLQIAFNAYVQSVAASSTATGTPTPITPSTQ